MECYDKGSNINLGLAWKGRVKERHPSINNYYEIGEEDSCTT